VLILPDPTIATDAFCAMSLPLLFESQPH
jgi:hypothetical protein